MAADPVKLQAQLHKLQAQFDELAKEKEAIAKGAREAGTATGVSARGVASSLCAHCCTAARVACRLQSSRA